MREESCSTQTKAVGGGLARPEGPSGAAGAGAAGAGAAGAGAAAKAEAALAAARSAAQPEPFMGMD